MHESGAVYICTTAFSWCTGLSHDYQGHCVANILHLSETLKRKDGSFESGITPKAGMFFCTTTGVLNLGDEERTIQKTNEQTNEETRRQRRTTNNKRHEGRFQMKRSTWTFMTFGVVRHSKKRMAETWKSSLLRGKSFEANLPCFWGFQGFCWVDEHSISMSFISCYLWGLWELQGLKPPMVQIGSQKNPEKNNSKNPS